MRLAVAMAFLVAGAGLVACFDIFHSTGDVLTACERDASTPGCSADRDASAPADTDFCAWSPQTALAHATHACAWLGACETPFGGNAFGPCMVDALLAYDCAANPDHRARGSVHATWDCLQQATTCDAVDACVFGTTRVPSCKQGPDYSACFGATSDVRVSCDDADGGRGHGESCALWGKTCAKIGNEVVCAGPASTTVAGGLGCGGGNPRTCDPDGTIHWCSDTDASDLTSVDIGVACSGSGTGKCGGFPTPAKPSWAACATTGADAGGSAVPCTPSLAATCEGDLAVSCPTGVRETLDCRALLGTTGSCVAGDLDPPFDWTSPCVVRQAADGGTNPSDGGGADAPDDASGDAAEDDAGDDASDEASVATAGADAADGGVPDGGAADASAPGTPAATSCAPGGGETCAGDALTSCARGAPFTVACHDAGLGPCRLVPAMGLHAACAPPSPP